jgi:hypothetical protein
VTEIKAIPSGRRFQDLTGMAFSRLAVLGYAGKTNDRKSLWLCRCVCGKETLASAGNLKAGKHRSCGCWLNDVMPYQLVELTGMRFGKLTVLSRATEKKSKNRHAKWFCRCDCGDFTEVAGDALRQGKTKSCGCLSRPHGLSRGPEHNSWRSMLGRCYYKKTNGYERYGGRGITVCDKWRRSFEAFYLDMGPRPGDEYSLERMDNTKGYYPGNMRWATKKEQSRNTRTNRVVEHDGRSMCLADWADQLGLPYHLLRKRFYSGWSMARIAALATCPDAERVGRP